MSDKTRNAAPLEARTHRTAPRTAVLALKPAAAAPQAPARWEEEVAVVAVRGELDRDALWAIDFTVERAAAEAGRIVLDLLEVTHLDYAGVSALTARRRAQVARGGDLRIAVKNPYVANILKAAGGAELVLCRSVEEASGGELAHAVEARGKVHALAGLRRKGT
jgi:anti-anti-sigma factor